MYISIEVMHIFFIWENFFFVFKEASEPLIKIFKPHRLSHSKMACQTEVFFFYGLLLWKEKYIYFIFHGRELCIFHLSSVCCFKKMYHGETVLYHEEYYHRKISYMNTVTCNILNSISSFTFIVPYTFLKEFTKKCPVLNLSLQFNRSNEIFQ